MVARRLKSARSILPTNPLFSPASTCPPVPCSDQRAPLTTNFTTDTGHRPQTTTTAPQFGTSTGTRHTSHAVCGLWAAWADGPLRRGSQEFPTTTKHTTRPESPETHDNPPGRGINHSDYNRGQLRPPAPTARPNKTRHQASSTGQCDATAPTKTANTIQRQATPPKMEIPTAHQLPRVRLSLAPPRLSQRPQSVAKTVVRNTQQTRGTQDFLRRAPNPTSRCNGPRIAPIADHGRNAVGHPPPRHRGGTPPLAAT